jgi:hypothetical protein
MMTYHNSDGGFSYWGGESTVFFTALGLSIIHRMLPHLKNVHPSLFEDGARFLKQHVVGGNHWSGADGHSSLAPRNLTDIALTAFIIHAMSIIPQRDISRDFYWAIIMTPLDWLSRQIGQYRDDPVVLALVLETISRVPKHDAAIDAVVFKDVLVRSANRDGDAVFWNRGSALTSEVESTARVAIAMNTAFPDDANIADLLRGSIAYLMATRGASGWRSTTDTLLASSAITKIGSSGATDFTISLDVNGKKTREEAIGKATMAWKIYDVRNMFIDDLVAGDNTIGVTMTGKGKCHVVVETKRYRVTGIAGKNGAAAISTIPPAGAIGMNSAFDLAVQVIPSREMESVMIEIPVPSIAKIGDRFKSVPGADHVEIKNNALCIFYTRLSKRADITIPLVACAPGTCRVDGKIYEMYRDDVIPAPASAITVSP